MITSALLSSALFINLTLLSGPELKSQVDPSVFRLTVLHANGEQSSGTGFLISESGLMVTNDHVIRDAAQMFAEDDERSRIPVMPGFYARSSVHDLALIQLDFSKLDERFTVPALTLATDTQRFNGGEDVYTLGHPAGVKIAQFTMGQINAVEPNPRRLRFDANISRGSSGSPLFDRENGEVIGVVTSFHTVGQEFNYATPVEYLHQLLTTVDASSPKLHPFRSGFAGGVAGIGGIAINLIISLLFFLAIAFGLKKLLRAAD